MRKHNQDQRPAAGMKFTEATVYLLNLVVIGYVSLPFAVVDPNFAEPYGTLFRIGAVVTFILTFAATLTALRSQASKLLLRTLRFLVGITTVAILALLFGVLQDALGANCPGFGATQPCTKSWTFVVQFGLSNVLFIPLTLALNIAFIVGLKQSVRKQR
jgi:hypothetical protein